MKIDEKLLEFATDREREFVAAINKHGSNRKAALALGANRRGVDQAIVRLKTRAARRGFAPEHDMTRPVPDGFHLKGTSTLYDADGNQKIQWVKSSIDGERQAMLIRETIAAMVEDLPRLDPVPAPDHCNQDLANCYVITDYHFGMLADKDETRGADYDMRIAETQLLSWFAHAIKSAPDASVGILAQLGDFLHWDGLEAVTPANKHVLDADTRFSKLVRVAIRVLRRVIAMLLEKHDHLYVLMAEGNHDPASSVWLRELLAALLEDEPRATVDCSPDPYYCIEHGSTSLFFHHGHKKRPAQIADVFAAKFRDVFGRTQHSFAHLGHMHHIDAKENNLMVVEQHRTLAPSDAYASRGGWLSGRDAKVITYSKRFGEVGRLTINSDMVSGVAA